MRCEVLAVDEPSLLRFTWRNKEGDRPSIVTSRLDETPTGTQLTYEHADIHGLEGMLMSRLLGRIRRRTLTESLPAALNALDDQARPQPGRVFDSRSRWG